MSVPMYSERPDRTAMGDLVRELLSKISELITTQIELAKTEVKVEGRKLAVAAAFGVAALIVGIVFLFFLGFTLILALAQAVGLVWAAVITTLFFLVLAGVAGMMMLREIQKNTDTVDVG